MAEPTTFLAWAESLASLDYYEILRVTPESTPLEIQQAFHALSLRCHPDRFVDDGPEVAAAAASVFKLAAQAYNVLRKPDLRQRYDAELGKAAGQPTRFDEHAVEQKKTFEQRTLHQIARNSRAKQFAAKADALLSAGKLEDARIQLVTAYQNDPGNAELKERLDILYEALALEPP